MIKTNKCKVVKMSVMGKVHHPIGSKTYRVSHEGDPRIIPGTGGITYGIHVGDSAFGLAGDHIEPSVSLRNDVATENEALMVLSCLGNEATIISGEARGEKGYVLGTHGGIEHTIVEFSEETLNRMTPEDKVMIKSYGQGLELAEFPEIKMMNMDPELFDKMQLEVVDGVIQFPVAAIVPAYLMGSGIGSPIAYSGDYDIMTQDLAEVKAHGIDQLRFGDFVFLKDCDNTFGRGYLTGAVSVGVVVHSDCIKMGHGPGIMILMTSKKPLIQGVVSNKCNVKDYL